MGVVNERGCDVSEKIVAAAIQIEGVTISLPRPARHGEVLICVNMLLPDVYQGRETQGFVTSEGRFVNRVQAFQLAWKEKQIISDRTGPELFSEDVWK